uniref:Listeriocin 743A n=1 Tax=Listeria innocua TaxID=1642 RepID=Q9AGM4_LISIO|nr:listeriocin 743A [Listeria innocua]
MKKAALKFIIVIAILGFSFSFFSIQSEAKSYGNGVQCNKKKCWVDWGSAISTIGNNSAANWATGGAAGWKS